MTKSQNIIFVPFVLAIFLLVSVTNISAEMPDTTPRMPDTTPRMPSFSAWVSNAFSKVTQYFFRMPDTTPVMPDTTPRLPDTTPVMPDILRFLANMLPSGIRKFLAPPSPSNLPQPLGMWQEEPTKKPTPTPTLPKGASIQSGPYSYKPEEEAAKAGVPSFTMSAPSGWAKYSGSGSELAHFESLEIDTEEVDGGEVTTNAVVIVRATGGYSNLDDFVNDYKASGKNVKGFQLRSSLARSVAGENGHQLEFTRKTKVGEAEITIRELNYLTHKNGIGFLIKGYASDSAWDKHVGEIQSALNSFKFN